MMEAMIPPQVRMSLHSSQKIKEAKEAQQKNKKMREKREGARLLSFFHTCASK